MNKKEDIKIGDKAEDGAQLRPLSFGSEKMFLYIRLQEKS